VARRIVTPEALAALAGEWVATYRIDRIVVGNRTSARDVMARLTGLGPPVVTVEEQGSTLRARARYFEEHPRRGWRRLLPLTLQVPPEPYDDYAAILLAEAYLAEISR
jgi:hypothetical protein